jgi:hypothetical protein
MKKPTGKPGGPNDRIHRCIAIEKRILDKTHSGSNCHCSESVGKRFLQQGNVP